MKIINLLENSMINKIAAGEVVERPVSIVKELVENSIDAGSTAITIEIKDGGISFIRITDNGSGINKEEVKTAFLRHATSKISNMDDLENVLSLGFRGEALSSISSVSQVEMITKTYKDTTGIRLELQAEEVLTEQEIGCADGTSIIVRNIFFNVPARRKFLKKPATESGYISEIINKLALGHPEIAFKFINNSTIILQTKGNNDLKTTILQVYGKEIMKKLILVDETNGDFSIKGYIGKPDICRANRKYENLFINGRYIKSDIVQNAIEDAFKTKLPIGKFPIFVLNISMNPTAIDVNVHPTKLEVRFLEEDFIYETVFKAVKKALSSENLIPEVTWDNKNFVDVVKNSPYKEESQGNVTELLYNIDSSTYINENIPTNDFVKENILAEPKGSYILDDSDVILQKTFSFEHISENNLPLENKQYLQKEVAKENQTEEIKVEEIKKEKVENTSKFEPVIKKSFFNNYKIIGQVFNTYWMLEQNNSIFMIDQHAAHERFLYEEILARVTKDSITSQRLLQPIILKFSFQEMQTIKDNMDILDNFGFDIEEFGEDSCALRAVPFIFKNPETVDFFVDIVDKLGTINSTMNNIYETKLSNIASISCKAAIKGNDKLDYQEAKSLIEKLLTLENPFTCPHGRPTIIEMSKQELEKKFKRIQ